MPVARIGDRGPLVKRLQKKLKQLGFGPVHLDGIYGKATARAVREFQTARKLGVDGIAARRFSRL